MPGCAAIGCNNRSEKGFTMKCFPRDTSLRNIWKQRVGRADWEPSNNSFLCHVHFEPNQWLLSPSGKVKLKKGAIPSIFTVTSTRKSPKKRQKLGSQEMIEDDLEEEYEVEYLESDQSFIMNLPNANIVPNFISLQTQNTVLPSAPLLQNFKLVSGDALKDLRNGNVIIVSDENNREIGKLMSDNSIILLEDEIGKENVQIMPEKANASRVKVEVKEEIIENGLSNHDYAEIERKLEEICHSGNETDSSHIVKNTSKLNSQSIETASTFSLDDLENGIDSVNENSNQEAEAEVTILRTCRKRKRRSRTESLNDDSVTKTSLIANETDETQMSGNISDIICDLETEKPANRNSVQIKSISSLPAKIVQNNQMNKSNKPIIKNDIQLEFRSEIVNRPVQNRKNNVTANSDPKSHNKLMYKLDIQGEVIEKLTNQLIMYKDMDRKMKSLTQELQNKNKEIELLKRRIAFRNPPVLKKIGKSESMNLSDSNEADLKNRLDSLEDKNKKLIKTATLEAQNRRNLECQVKSRDNQIKELNWKLEKASKFLDRAEKNANNYRKKMLSMQALVRRKKLSHEKSSIFDEFLVGQADRSYSENALRMACEIEKSCGQEGYQKLLSYEFPLPALADLRHESSIESIHEFEGDESVILENEAFNSKVAANSMKSIVSIKTEKKETEENNTSNESKESNENDENIEDVEYLDLEFMNENNETVSGTVQDIFNEHSDNDDFDLDELKKHILIDLTEET